MMVGFLLALFGNQVVPNLFKVNWVRGLSGVFVGAVVEDLIGEGKLGPMGVDLSIWSRWSMETPETLAVDRDLYGLDLAFYEAIGLGVEGW